MSFFVFTALMQRSWICLKQPTILRVHTAIDNRACNALELCMMCMCYDNVNRNRRTNRCIFIHSKNLYKQTKCMLSLLAHIQRNTQRRQCTTGNKMAVGNLKRHLIRCLLRSGKTLATSANGVYDLEGGLSKISKPNHLEAF